MHVIRTASILSLLALTLAVRPLPAQTPAPATATKPMSAGQTFDVATVRPSAPLDMQKLAADIQAGRMPKIGAHVTDSQAEYTYMSLKELIAVAYGLKGYQVSGPDWLSSQRFDIVAKLPAGSTKDDAPAMLKTLLIERFHLTAHRDTQEHPALALVVGKSGPKLKEVPAPAVAPDDGAPLKPGEMKMDTADGPARITRNSDGSTTVNLGAKGSFVQRLDPANQTLRLEATGITMQGFVDMLNQVMQMGGPGARQIVNQTDLKGHYEAALELSLKELMAAARAQGMDLPTPAGAGGDSKAATPEASDPTGGSSVYESVEKLGLKLEPRKAMVEQIVVEKADKVPTEN